MNREGCGFTTYLAENWQQPNRRVQRVKPTTHAGTPAISGVEIHLAGMGNDDKNESQITDKEGGQLAREADFRLDKNSASCKNINNVTSGTLFFLHLEDFSTVRSGGGGEEGDAAAGDRGGGGPKHDHGLPGPQDAGCDLRNHTHGEWKKGKQSS